MRSRLRATYGNGLKAIKAQLIQMIQQQNRGSGVVIVLT